jgi:hypothetical protein
MYKPKRTISILILILGLLSCNLSEKHEGKTPVARVFDKYLYIEDLAGVVPKGMNQEDSIKTIKSYIDFWVKRQAMTKTAELNLAEGQKDVAKELENYRMDLLIFRYKELFIKQNLDTIVTRKQIADFYQKHEDEFLLSQPAIQCNFVKITKNNPNIYLVKNLYRSNLENEQKQLKEFCEDHSAIYTNYNNDWVYFKDIIIQIPVRIDDQEQFLRTKNFVEAEDSAFYYFLNIRNFRLKNAISPLIFVEGNIQSMILKQRKQALINDIEVDIYNSMLDKNNIEIYKND